MMDILVINLAVFIFKILTITQFYKLKFFSIFAEHFLKHQLTVALWVICADTQDIKYFRFFKNLVKNKIYV